MFLSKISRLCKCRKRAVSPVVATVLLIAITVAAAAMVYLVVMPMISGSPEPVVQNVDSWQDTNANGLCDEVTVNVRNMGTADMTVKSADLLKNDVKVDSWSLEEERSVDSASRAYITLNTDTEADELTAGDSVKVRVNTEDDTAISDEFITPGQFTGDTTTIRVVISAWSYQDEGTDKYNDTLKIGSLDGDWGPTETGSVDHAYYLTGRSPHYFDGVFVQFEGYDRSSYNPTIHIYVKDGLYSSQRHHYTVTFAGTGTNPDWTVDQAHDDSRPNDVSAFTWDDDQDETGLEVTKALTDSGWTGVTSGVNFWLFIRLWDASVDNIWITLS